MLQKICNNLCNIFGAVGWRNMMDAVSVSIWSTLCYHVYSRLLSRLILLLSLTTVLDIGTPQKKEYFLCAETPSAARAWVSTLHAAQLVLQAHKEAVNSLGDNGPAKLGTVATVVAVANATAIEATKEVEAAMKISLRAALGSTTNKLTKGQLDDLTIMMVRSFIYSLRPALMYI